MLAHDLDPPVIERAAELKRLLEAYASDTVAGPGATRPGLRPNDLERVLAKRITALDEIEEVARSLVALRNCYQARPWRRESTGGPQVDVGSTRAAAPKENLDPICSFTASSRQSLHTKYADLDPGIHAYAPRDN